MAIRVTQGLMIDRALHNLNYQSGQLLSLQQQLATGLKVNAPSDDPLAARRAINIRETIARDEQYIANVTAAGPQLVESASAVQTVIKALQRANELSLQGASTTMSQSQRDQLAIEINQLLESVLSEGNHQTNGKYIFGGTRTLNAPFVPTRDANGEITAVTYAGNATQASIAVADGVTVVVNETGQEAFQSDTDVMQFLINVRDNLRAGDFSGLQQRLADFKVAQDQALVSLARIGSAQNRLTGITANTEDYIDQLEISLSDNVDADYAETVIHLQAQINAFTAALNAAGKVIQQSLLDYI